MIRSELFGRIADGTPVTMYTIENRWGETVELLDYGASIHGVRIRDRKGELRDVTLGAPDAAALQGFSHEGVTIGRVANRIAYGRCVIDGKVLQLDCNQKGHFLHGGSGNYAHRLFQASASEQDNEIVFSLLDRGEGGFGCQAQVTAAFRFDDDHRLRIQYQMLPEGTTIFCPTNHVYFDLSGTGDVLNHSLRIAAERFAPKGPLGMPQGGIEPVEGTAMDFRRSRTLGAALLDGMDGLFAGETPQIDDTFLLDQRAGPAAELACPGTGLAVQVHTDMPAMVVFSPFVRKPRQGKAGRYYAGYCGVALETQFVPNAVNCDAYELPVCRKGERFCSETTYSFIKMKDEDKERFK